MRKLDFMIIGAQKCGTTALASFLGEHPDISMSSRKEVHLFDAPDIDQLSSHQIDARYSGYFENSKGRLLGEATPIYCYFEEIAPRLRDYHPELKLIVLLRDPVERAYSHYLMERERQQESLPYALALLAEKIRLSRDKNKYQHDSAHRLHSYRARGLYAQQIKNLYRHFSQHQVLLLSTTALREHHADTLNSIWRFLEIDPVAVAAEEVFARHSQTGDVPVSSFFLRKSFRADLRALQSLVDFSVREWL